MVDDTTNNELVNLVCDLKNRYGVDSLLAIDRDFIADLTQEDRDELDRRLSQIRRRSNRPPHKQVVRGEVENLHNRVIWVVTHMKLLEKRRERQKG